MTQSNLSQVSNLTVRSPVMGQKQTMPSLATLATNVLLGLKLMELMVPLWPCSTASVSHVARDHTLIS